MKPLVLFDMDGTILNSVPTIAESCNAALAENGLPQHPLPAYNGMVGNGMRVLIRRACPADAPAELQEKVIASYDRIYTDACRRPGIIYPGIPALLQKLRTQGVLTAVGDDTFTFEYPVKVKEPGAKRLDRKSVV